MPCRIEFTIIGMTVTDWSFTFRCSPPHLAVTQLLQVTAQSTFGLDRTFTFLFHNHHRRTRKLARELPTLAVIPRELDVPRPSQDSLCLASHRLPKCIRIPLLQLSSDFP